MAGPRLLDPKITTKDPQPRHAGRSAQSRGRAGRTAPVTAAVRGAAREGSRGNGRVVVEVVGGSRCTPRGGWGTGDGRRGMRTGSGGSARR
jgi:hypothetical protein